ncbi:hypothetical protein JCM19055_2259 [Geomicrobium sp. JCM 19055]|nr:hypothetical protein JCM19055_2259 [Geomicrobium sp. JCM 19055]
MKAMSKKMIALIVVLLIVMIVIALFPNDSEVLSIDEMTSKVIDEYPGEVVYEGQSQMDSSSSMHEFSVRFQGTEYQLFVDEHVGTIHGLSKVGDADRDNDEEKRSQDVIITSEDALTIAKGHFDGELDSIELEEEDGRIIWVVELERNDLEAEIEIDAFTGEVLIIAYED